MDRGKAHKRLSLIIIYKSGLFPNRSWVYYPLQGLMRVEKTLSYFIEYIIFDRKIPMSHRVYHCNDGTCKFERIVSEVSM